MTNSSIAPNSPYQSLSLYLKTLKLSHMLHQWEAIEQQATQHHWSYAQFLLTLCEGEVERRWQARLKRSLSEAQLPNAKTLSSFDFSHLSTFNPAPLIQLAADASWLKDAHNCLMFGPSGVGKTHLAAAITRAIIELGYRAKFFGATALVQQLQHAKLQLQLPTMLKKLDRYDLLVVDDLGYVKKSETETSVLFELIAHRYERKSLLVTANQPFSQWDAIFADEMMTVAAVDRLVHHAVIIELNAQSYRKRSADNRGASPPAHGQSEHPFSPSEAIPDS